MVAVRNRLLAGLSRKEYARILPDLARVSGFLSDTQTGALVSREGSVDWYSPKTRRLAALVRTS